MTENQKEHYVLEPVMADEIMQQIASAMGVDPLLISRMTIVLEADNFAYISVDRIARESAEMRLALDRLIDEVKNLQYRRLAPPSPDDTSGPDSLA